MNNYEKMYYDDLMNIGYTTEKIATDLFKIVTEEIPNLPDEHAGTIEILVNKLESNKDRFVTIVTEGKIVGFITVDPLSKKNKKQVSKGTFDENEIEIFSMVDNNVYDLYFNTIAISKEHRTYLTLHALTEAFIEKIYTFTKRGIYFKSMYATACTREGKNLCRFFDMKYVKEHKEEGDIYKIDFIPIDVTHNILKRYPNLIKVYSTIK